MRFNSVAEVKASAEQAAASDFKMYIEFGAGLNPYSTLGARNCWQRGYSGEPGVAWVNMGWNYQYQRGAAAYRLIERLLDVA